MMDITKTGEARQLDPAGELEAVNRFAKAKLTAEEVYTFSVLLCDNEVDRDLEKFSEKTLGELRELFVGKTGITDHEWRAANQVARIYRTELQRPADRKNSLGEDYVFLKGYAYMLRSEQNAALIAEIDAGIKRETSVGCSVARSLCSVCGQEIGTEGCRHVKGRQYGGKLCFAVLDGAVDAYEWSFVAVPAQKSAGVMKRFGEEGLKGFVRGQDGAGFASEFEALSKEAALGRLYREELRREVKRLALLCEIGRASCRERV